MIILVKLFNVILMHMSSVDDGKKRHQTYDSRLEINTVQQCPNMFLMSFNLITKVYTQAGLAPMGFIYLYTPIFIELNKLSSSVNIDKLNASIISIYFCEKR